jgi:hypothetical protein
VVIRRIRVIPLVISLFAACIVFAGVSVGTANPAFAAPVVTVCLTNSPSFCADVKDSNNVSGQPVWLYRPIDGAKDYHWYEVPTPCNDNFCLCPVSNCLEFEDVQNPNLCMALSSNLYGVSLINCHLADGTGGTARAAWIQIGNNLENYFLLTSHDLSVNGPLYSGRYLYVAPHVNPGGNVWQQWSGY